MTERPGIIVTGASGRMGRMLIDMIAASDRVQLAGCIERSGHDWIGRDLLAVLPGLRSAHPELNGGAIPVTDDPLDLLAAGARAIVDFSAPAATVGFAALAAQARVVHVIGTTGLDAADLARISAAARHAVIVRAGNMSLGVNILTGLTRRIAAALGPDYDIEIVEAHHSRKVDAPSGTALMLGTAAAEGRGVALGAVSDRGRDGVTGARVPGHIGFSAIRGGDIVGEHDVIFAGPGERIVLRHVATDRAIFARGALQAAVWGLDQPPGEYGMDHVLGL